MSSTILSTKQLTKAQQALLLNAGVGFVHYDAIATNCVPFVLGTDADFFIFTSQTAVNCFLKKYGSGKDAKACCVGGKTREALQKHGFKVLECADNAQKLADAIVAKHQGHSFLFLAGNLRHDALPQTLTKNNVQYKDVCVYKTKMHAKTFKRHFDGVLFFSPSGVQSFVKHNSLTGSVAFCIGETTAAEAKKHTSEVIIANKPTIENVLVQSIKNCGR